MGVRPPRASDPSITTRPGTWNTHVPTSPWNMEHFLELYFSRFPRELCATMSSSSSSVDPSLSDILAEIKSLNLQLLRVVSSVQAVSVQCRAIQDFLQSDEEFTMDVDEDSEGEEPSRVRTGSLARSNAGVRMLDDGPRDVIGVSSAPVASSDESTRTQSPVKVTPPSKGLYRFR